MPAPRLSIVVPSRHRPAALERCLRAIAATDLRRDAFEVIVVLDGLDVEQPEAPAGLDVRWLRQEHAGPGAARNRGAAAARGDVLGFTDDDCAPAPDWARRLLARVDASPGALVGGRFMNGVAGNRWAEASHLLLDVVVRETVVAAAPLAFAASANIGLRAETFATVGGFDESFGVGAAEDRDFCARCVEAGHPIVLAPEAVVLHRNDVSAARFARQHFAYGKGAVTYQRARVRRGQGTSFASGGLYRRLALAAVRRGLLGRVAFSQVAYAAGVAAALSPGGRAARPPRARP